jgi:hypothetical protein
MNDQVMPPNPAGAGERGGSGVNPEDLKAPGAAGPESPRPEVTPQPGSTPPPAGSAAGNTMPAVAGDVDVIEPEWVEKAEQVVRSHHGDPYGEEEAVEELQEDYLEKRYGFKVADPNQEKKGGATGKPGGA